MPNKINESLANREKDKRIADLEDRLEKAQAQPTREDLYRAAISCGHEITKEKIVLYRDDKKDGNALSQLADRLIDALQSIPAQPAKGEAK